jgi:hypothetical protein
MTDFNQELNAFPPHLSTLSLTENSIELKIKTAAAPKSLAVAGECVSQKNKRVEDKLRWKKNASTSTTLLVAALFSWSKTVDINAYNKIFTYRNSRTCQCLWLFIFLISSAATFWIIGLSIVKYLDYDVVSQIEVIYEKPTLFPTVTICDNDPFTSKEAQYLYERIAKQTGNKMNAISKVNNSLNYLVQMYAASPALSDDERKKLGLDQSLVNYCRFYASRCDDALHWYEHFFNCTKSLVGLEFFQQLCHYLSIFFYVPIFN